MKKLFATLLILTIGFSACHKATETTQTNNTGTGSTAVTKIAPDGFKYVTNTAVTIDITLLTNDDKPLTNVLVDVYAYQNGALGNKIFTALSNTQGAINGTVSVSGNTDTLVVDAKSFGVLHNAKVYIVGNTLSCTLGGSQGFKGNVAGSFDVLPGGSRAGGTIGMDATGNTGRVGLDGSLNSIQTNTKFISMGSADNLGRPLYLTTPGDVISSEMLGYLSYSLPEGKSVATLHPQYITSGAASDIVIQKQSDVWVTFLYEGAGYTNSVGYYVYNTKTPPNTVKDIDSIHFMYPNSSLLNSGGGMHAGDKVYIGNFPAGKTIGFVLFANAWQGGANVNTGAAAYFSDANLNPETDPSLQRHTVLLNYNNTYIIGFEDMNRQYSGCDHDFNDVCLYATSNPVDAISQNGVQPIDKPVDTDGDGVADIYDAFPKDPTRAYINYFPSQTTYGTLAYEDMWPVTADYDLNDLVVSYQYQIISNAQNNIVEMYANYVPLAAGATYNSGFGIQFPFPSSAVNTVTGQNLSAGTYIKQNANGTEAGQSNAVIIPFDLCTNLLHNPGNAAIVNTDMSKSKVTGDTAKIYLSFTTPISAATFGSAPFNPFLISNARRGYEVHLPGQLPTSLANTTLFSTYQDATNPGSGIYYVTKDNHPWALNFLVPFSYPVEGVNIANAYLHFLDWANSGGTTYTDWFSNTSAGYRNSANIYSK